MTSKFALSSLAMDLKRVAIGYNLGSTAFADRFLSESLKRKREINLDTVKPYVANLLKKIPDIKHIEKDKDKAEIALMYSTLFQNAALSKNKQNAQTF